MQDLNSIEGRATRYRLRIEAMRSVLDAIVRNCNSVEQVGARALEVALYLECPNLKIENKAELSRMLGISRQRASTAVDTLGAELLEIIEDLEKGC